MKRIWAPWRMEYIRKAREPGCFLCDIFQSKDDRNNLVLKRGEICALLMNRYPYNSGHMMAAPYRHVNSLEDMNEKEQMGLMSLASLACELLRKTIHPDGFNLGMNLGAAAGAGLKDHIHLHIVPRWEGDTNFMQVLSEVRVIPQPLDDLWDQLHESLTQISQTQNLG